MSSREHDTNFIHTKRPTSYLIPTNTPIEKSEVAESLIEKYDSRSKDKIMERIERPFQVCPDWMTAAPQFSSSIDINDLESDLSSLKQAISNFRATELLEIRNERSHVKTKKLLPGLKDEK